MVETLLDAAARVLIREGYSRTTTNRVAQEAGVSVGSLYQYFPSKDAIVVALLRRHRQAMLEVLATQLAGIDQAPVETAVREVIRAVLKAHGVNPRLHKVMIEQLLRRDARAEVGDFEPKVEELVRAAQMARKEHLRVKHVDLAAFLLVRLVISVSQTVVVDHPERSRDPRLEDEMTDLVLRYLVA
jgi:AcrR family transcriptional regulator